MGREAQQQVRKTVPVARRFRVTAYIAPGRQAARGPRARARHIPTVFRSRIIATSTRSRCPGGPVWIHRGILHAAANESQVAGVLAHEIAHIAQRHAADQITKQLVANGFLGLLGAVLGNDPGGARTAQAGAQNPRRRLPARSSAATTSATPIASASRSSGAPAGILAAWPTSWTSSGASRAAIQAPSTSFSRRIPHPPNAPSPCASSPGSTPADAATAPPSVP